MKSVRDFDVNGKRILIRCDFNVPLDNKGNILDDFKIRESLPTIQYLVENNAKIILMSHLGEPEGKMIPILKLDKIKNKIEELLSFSVKKIDDCIGPVAENSALNLSSGKILLLENLRFHKEETDDNSEFAKKLSQLGEIFINDAFAECHRNYASIVSVPKFLPCGAGLLLEREIKNLKKVLENPEKPIVVLIGGAKVSDKVKFIEKILEIADWVIVSGLIKEELIKAHSVILQNNRIIGPSNNLDAPDIDSETVKLFCDKVLKAKTILWNGPFGKVEEENFKKGTLQIVKSIIKSGAFSVVGGGSTIEFLKEESLVSKFNHVSTGGGAMLEFLSGEKLPGIQAIDRQT